MSCDVLIAGAGPAGATLAALLARPGRSILLVHREVAEAGVPDETVVAGARPLFERLGLADLAPNLGPLRHGTLWGSDELVWRPVAPSQRGMQIERAPFDAALRARALERGAELWIGAVRGALDAHGTLLDGVQPERRGAGLVVAAGGRTASDTLASARVEHALPETLAFTARVAAQDAEHVSVIEAVREGWLWWLGSPRGGASLTLFADRSEVAERGRDELWQRALAAARGPGRGPGRGPVHELVREQGLGLALRPERGTSATARLRIGPVLACGDAIASVDPLASQGLEKALASAEHTALCVNTLLAGTCPVELVLAHRRAWERRLYRAHVRTTLEFYARERRFESAPFWNARHAASASWLEPAPMPARFAPHPELAPATALAPQGDRLAPTEGWALPGEDEVLHALGGVQLGAYLQACRGGATLDQALLRAARDARCLASTPRSVTQALEQLWREGFLIEA